LQEIPRIAHPAQALFESVHLRRTPVVIDGLMTASCLERFSPRQLAKSFGAREVQVESYATSDRTYDPTRGRVRREAMAIGALVDALEKQTAESSVKLYLAHAPIEEHFPELAHEFPTQGHFPELAHELRMPWIPDGGLLATNLWLSGSGSASSLHYDWLDNFLCQMHGEKSGILFPPSETENLYPCPSRFAYDHFSQVDADNPDLLRFPLYSSAKPVPFVLRQGEVLYMPAFWWHHVRTQSCSVSVNFWFKPEIDQYLVPNGVQVLRQRFDANRLQDIGKIAELGKIGRLIDVGRHLFANGVKWGAVLFAAAELESHVREIARRKGVEFDETKPRTIKRLVGELESLGVSRGEVPVGWTAWEGLVALARKGREHELPPAEIATMLMAIERLLAAA
jgi:hypothetical protein